MVILIFFPFPKAFTFWNPHRICYLLLHTIQQHASKPHIFSEHNTTHTVLDLITKFNVFTVTNKAQNTFLDYYEVQ